MLPNFANRRMATDSAQPVNNTQVAHMFAVHGFRIEEMPSSCSRYTDPSFQNHSICMYRCCYVLQLRAAADLCRNSLHMWQIIQICVSFVRAEHMYSTCFARETLGPNTLHMHETAAYMAMHAIDSVLEAGL